MNTTPCILEPAWSRVITRPQRRVIRGATRLLTAPLFHVDAFARRPFEGNPAAVCLPSRPCSKEWMQQVAAEMNVSETAFVVPTFGGFDLRWFTPTGEVSLCGHATLAAAHVLWETGQVAERSEVRFRTRSGPLIARRVDGSIELNLPSRPVVETRQIPRAVRIALDVSPISVGRTLEQAPENADFVLELEGEAAVRAVRPDFAALRSVPGGVIVTARADDPQYDFVSRYFAPWWGIDEDLVTGSAHCALAPYWAGRLGKTKLVGRQISARGGVVEARVDGDRVHLCGRAVTVSQGVLVA
ncbi:MAG: PhzF family phenazine biosynthesis protein [Gemmatimonadetes bacterium]|nr:PhzF family phenazine biosynthesis protein [Gemmatimonadota bacterium]